VLNGWSDSLWARTMMRMCDVFGIMLDTLTGRRPEDPLPDGQATPAAGVWHAAKIAAEAPCSADCTARCGTG